MSNKVGLEYIILGMLILMGGLLFGSVAAFQFLYPDFLEGIPFERTRPLHVTTMVSWIFLAATGGIYHYLATQCNVRFFSSRLASWQFWVFLITGAAIGLSYFLGNFGGREYLSFAPILSIPIFVAWVLFGINVFRTLFTFKSTWPVYFWMWGTGIVFFIITFSESYLWVFPYFRENMIRELTVQWKSYGALIGSWNMLVYGTAIYVMSRITEDENLAYSRMAFGLYFLGLLNLMLGWAHHTYPVPSALFIRELAYIISMTELFILGRMIWKWRDSVSNLQRYRHRHSFQFLFASEFWVFANLILAIAISIPAINLISHGTHVTVAHAMGTTIGINTMILLASALFILEEAIGLEGFLRHRTLANIGLWLSNIALFIFWLALLAAGFSKGIYEGDSFQEMMFLISPFLLVFSISGVGVLLGLWLVLAPTVHLMGMYRFNRESLNQSLSGKISEFAN